MAIVSPFYTSEPISKTVYNAGTDYCHYTIKRVTAMADDVPTATIDVYSSTCYAPDAYDEVEFGAQLRSMIDSQIGHIKTLQYRGSQNPAVYQGTNVFNSYFIIDDGGSDDTIYSVLYDTRGLTAIETGAKNSITGGPGEGYAANLFPDQYVTQGQYISVMYRNPSNYGQTETHSFGCTYSLKNRNIPDPSTGYETIYNLTLDSSISGQSFRYAGPAKWEVWTGSQQNAGIAVWVRFWMENSKGKKVYLTPKLYKKECDDPETCYLYYVNSLGGIDFLRCKYERTTNTERSTYESNVDINSRFNFQEETYSQKRWNTWTLHTALMSDADSPNIADICTTRWAWLFDRNDTYAPWRSVSVTDTSAKVKTKSNEGGKLFIYDINVSENIKSKIV